MSPLYDFKKGFDYKYLNSNDVENIGNIILTNSIPFINQNRKIRLKWMKSSWKIKLPQNKQLGILQSIKLFITKPLVFRACEVSILKNLENYRVHGELIFLPQAEKGTLPDIRV